VNSSSSQTSLPSLRRAAAALVASAIVDLFPQVILYECHATDIGFRCVFSCPHPVDQQGLTQLEEKARSMAKAGSEVRNIEMMRENSATLLMHHHQLVLAENVLEWPDTLVPLIQIGQFYLPIEPTEVTSTTEVSAIKLFEVTALDDDEEDEGGEGLYQIEGTVCSNPQELKKFLKKIQAAKEKDHQELGPSMQLFFEETEGYYWQPKGLILRDLLINWWTKAHLDQGFKPVITPESDASIADRHSTLFTHSKPTYRDLPIKYSEWLWSNAVDLDRDQIGLYNSSPQQADRTTTFCSNEQLPDLLISSLQFIERTARIFGFERQIVWCPGAKDDFGSTSLVKALEQSGIEYLTDTSNAQPIGRVEVRLLDPLDRQWSTSFLTVEKAPSDRGNYLDANSRTKTAWVITRSTFGSLETTIAHLIEKEEGRLPFWLTPEQIRLIPLNDQYDDYVAQIAERLEQEFRVGRDQSEEPLSARIYAAEKAKVPYLLIIGDQEEKRKLVSVRKSGSQGKSATMTLDSLIDELKTESQNTVR
jgi:threonyl-tRNA synthetase